jgi:NAD(P)-dependent dehydrogenase (short-subunit alcohol dehydrogenase family)
MQVHSASRAAKQSSARHLRLNHAFFFLTQAFAKTLVQANRPGAIVNIGSM